MEPMDLEPKKGFAISEPASGDASPTTARLCPVSTAPSADGASLEEEPASLTGPPSSCVSRASSEQDCARQSFIVWAAVKRNRSIRMAATERLTCPLLRCGDRFHDHEAMLRHLADCPHLATGEYVCYECMKVERFNDARCKCCRGGQGQPTKRRKMINMARTFFTNIGHKNRKSSSPSKLQADLSVPPPSYESLDITGLRRQEEEEQQQPHPQPQQPQRPHLELNGREIVVELDSRQMRPSAQLDPVNYDDQPAPSDSFQEPFVVPSPIPRTLLPPQQKPERRNLLPTQPHPSMSPSDQLDEGSGDRRPSLALDTQVDRYRNIPRSNYLSPSSSLRSTKSSNGVSPVTPWSADSGTSASSAAWTMSSGMGTGLASPITPQTPSEQFTMPQEEFAFVNPKDMEICPDEARDKNLEFLSELPGDDPMSMALPPGAMADPMALGLDGKDNFSWMSSVSTELSLGTSVNMMFTDQNMQSVNEDTRPPPAPMSKATSGNLVQSAWDALLEHTESSMSKVAHLVENPLAQRLHMESAQTVAAKGLETFRKMLDGKDPADPLDYLCFIHVIYSFSLVIHEDDLAERCSRLFKQALAYRSFLAPALVDCYWQIVAAIWQPERLGLNHDPGHTGRSSSLKGKAPEYRTSSRNDLRFDPLAIVGQNFLDDLETAVLYTDPQASQDVVLSALWTTHMSEIRHETSRVDAFSITANFITQVLCQTFQDIPSLFIGLTAIDHRVRGKQITTVRRLELEILQAGKVSVFPEVNLALQGAKTRSSTLIPGNIFCADLEKNVLENGALFDEFVPRVRDLCDPIYTEHGFHPRAKYQTLTVSLVESMMKNLAEQNRIPAPANPNASPNLPDPMYEFLEPLGHTWDDQPMDAVFMNPVNSAVPHQNQMVGFTAPIQNMVNTERNLVGSNRMSPLNRVSVERSTPSELSHEALTASAAASPALSRPAGPETADASPAPPPIAILPSTPGHENHGSDDQVMGEPSSVSSSGQKVEANDCCEICGYRPKGDPQWFRGSMAKHKKMQHSTGPPVIYRCPFPGCTSAYRNRQDNLRQHQLEKNHFVDEGSAQGRRPMKRKKV